MISKEEIEKFLELMEIPKGTEINRFYDSNNLVNNTISIKVLIQKALEHFKSEVKENELLHSVSKSVSKSVNCKLDRLKAECSIAQFTTPKDSCEGCGHYC